MRARGKDASAFRRWGLAGINSCSVWWVRNGQTHGKKAHWLTERKPQPPLRRMAGVHRLPLVRSSLKHARSGIWGGRSKRRHNNDKGNT